MYRQPQSLAVPSCKFEIFGEKITFRLRAVTLCRATTSVLLAATTCSSVLYWSWIMDLAVRCSQGSRVGGVLSQSSTCAAAGEG